MSVRGNILTVYLLTFGVGVSASRFFQNASCGIDRSPIDVVFEGLADIETYPWLGYLFYPMGKKRYTTVVVLVTRQIVIGTATDIDKLPKNYFRARAKVVIGSSCSGPLLAVRDYTYHPDYGMNTYSALAMVQLELDGVHIDLHPICPPPTYVIDAEFYAMTLSDDYLPIKNDCNKPLVRLYEMKYVDPAKCKTYYRKSGLDMSTIWPTHTACAKARHGGECLWRSGAALVLRQGGRWNLVGFGVHGPGCSAPARFLDYGMYHQWVRRSVLRIGRPTITRIGDNQIILRRSLSNIQRFGLCDQEEMKMLLYKDSTSVTPDDPRFKRIRYNMTIYANVEYSCVMFKASTFNREDKPPSLRLRRWCAGPRDICSDFQSLEIDFYVEINFLGKITYDLSAYGRTAIAIDTRRAMWYVNNRTTTQVVPDLEAIQDLVHQQAPMTWYSGEWQDSPEAEEENVTTSAPL